VNVAMTFLEGCKKSTEELILYSSSRAYLNLAELSLIPKDQLATSFMSQAPFLVYPNEWVRGMTLQFCKIAYKNMTDPEIFCRIRTPFKCYLQNSILLMSHKDNFEGFIIPSVNRLAIDLHQAKIDKRPPYTNHDASTLAILDKTLKEMVVRDLSNEYYEEYENYIKILVKKRNIESTRIDVTTQIETGLVDSKCKRIVACQPYSMKESELEEYIDSVYYPHEVPTSTQYILDNHGLNDIKDYINFNCSADVRDCKWKEAYKKQWLCKALNLYVKDINSVSNTTQKRHYSYVVQHKWEDWKPQGNLIVTLYKHKAPVSSIATTEDNKRIATGSSDGICYIWNVEEIERDIDLNSIDEVQAVDKVRAIRFIDDDNVVVAGTDRNNLVFKRIDESNYESVTKSIGNEREGGIVDIFPLKLSSQKNTFICPTQSGTFHLYDMRVKKSISLFTMDCRCGILSCASTGDSDLYIYIGTVGGYIGIYDIRFNLLSSLRKYACDTPLSDICVYSNTNFPSSSLLFSAPSTPTPHLDLFNMDKKTTEWSFVADSEINETGIKKSLITKEVFYTDVDQLILKRLIKHLPIEEELLVENKMLKSECANIYKKPKGLFKGNNRLTKLLCPKTSSDGQSAPFLLAAGLDRKIRYLYFGDLIMENMVKKSMMLNSPDNNCYEYVINSKEAHVLSERIAEEGDCKRKGGSGMLETKSGEIYKIASASHSDAILDMALLDLPIDTFLVTCSRDNTVKIWT